MSNERALAALTVAQLVTPLPAHRRWRHLVTMPRLRRARIEAAVEQRPGAVHEDAGCASEACLPTPAPLRAAVEEPVPKPRSPGVLLEGLLTGNISVTEISFVEELALRRWCRERIRASEASIQQLVDEGHMRRARRARLKHIACREVLLHGLLCAARRQWPSKMAMTPHEREECRRKQLAQSIARLPQVGKFGHPARGSQFLHRKKANGHRPIIRFSWVDYARQIVLKSALLPFSNLHEGQAMLARDPNRRGPAAVRETLLAKLNKCDENSVFVQFDVRNFYGSISHDWLEGHLGIDPALVRKHLHTGGMLIRSVRGMTIVRGHHEANRRGETGRRGIPQGSASSPIIAEQVMASVIRSAAVLRDLSPDTWSDNLAVIVPREQVGDVERLVRAAFAEHGAGPFHLTLKTSPVTREFQFLKVWYRKMPDGAEAYIPESVSAAWEASVSGRVALASANELDALEAVVRGKLVQWGWCPSAAERGRYLLRYIASTREHMRS